MLRCEHWLLGVKFGSILTDMNGRLIQPDSRESDAYSMRSLDWWDHGFESHWGHGCSFSVFFVCCVGSGLCDLLIACSDHSYRVCVCVQLCLINLNNDFLIIKPTRYTNFWNLFWNENLHVSDSSSVHHKESFTVHPAMVYVIQFCRHLSSSRIRMELQFHPDPARKLSTNLYDVYHGWVYSEWLLMMDRGTVRNM
jgi:hypothetical protein